MAGISRVSLFGKLTPPAYRAIESATVFCKLRGNPYVELVHWLHQVLQLQDSDLHRIVRRFDLDPGRLAHDFLENLDRLPRGASSISDFSPQIEDATERGWIVASLMYKAPRVSTGHLIIGILQSPGLRNALPALSREFAKITLDTLTDEFVTLVDGSPEAMPADSVDCGGAAPGQASGAMAPAAMGKQEALAKFSVDLTDKARKGEIDPIVGRDDEIRQIVDILMRRRQNNPILTGEAGVGKTAVVEGFARRIVAGDVPPPLKNVMLRTLDVGLLQAGASMKGEFENRLRQVIEEVQASPKPIILFIDEAHTLIGAGGAVGTGDAANLLKPALARGTLRTIAATTWAEYKKYFEKDPALVRRFQAIQVEEPGEEKAILMMRGLTSALETHHKVQILDEALEAAVRLSHRYIPARQLPDKAVSLLDTAAARVAISQHAVPAEVDDSRRHIEALRTELEIIAREAAVGIDTSHRGAEAEEKLTAETDRLAELEARWQAEKALVDHILGLRTRLRSGGGAVEGTGSELEARVDATQPAGQTEQERDALLAELKQRQAELAALQGETPLILPTVDEQAIASVVGDWTGIPVGRMVKNEIETVLKLADTLNQRVIGQSHGLEMIAKRIQTSRAKLDNPNKPVGVFLLCGPSGVGKTETALALAETLYGGEHNVITINMSEFQEAHTVSTLKGAPPGYVGYGEGGILTEAVRRKPYSVVLLDEVEKAHSDVHEIFFQVFDKGVMEDGEGRLIDFKNTLILLTSNVGSDLIMNLCRDPELMPDPDAIAKALRQPLLTVFPAALLGRIVTIPYHPLTDEMIGNIIRLQLDRIQKRVRQTHRIPFTYDDEVVTLIASRCRELESGGRMIDAILTNTMLPAISNAMLGRLLEGSSVARVHVSVRDKDFWYDFD
ncbi:type VI secretion system ATPase TssH [Azospirillum sp. A1-3]|uniref:type VI secretion system ATPase TssH n=1 Tax=Azospirillum sp. A1-3 TaxID=185874 RepID=UPI002077842C|nr:type VI secretion system ATPase TssH [Azospirillum sp. A1-3]MCM8738873.1 type VI secretion system ATPase TssH [Azospirillum sp. A1-3]